VTYKCVVEPLNDNVLQYMMSIKKSKATRFWFKCLCCNFHSNL